MAAVEGEEVAERVRARLEWCGTKDRRR